MAFGGRIAVDLSDDRWTLTGVATKLKLDEKLWDTLCDANAKADITAAQVHFALIPGELAQQGRHSFDDC